MASPSCQTSKEHLHISSQKFAFLLRSNCRAKEGPGWRGPQKTAFLEVYPQTAVLAAVRVPFRNNFFGKKILFLKSSQKSIPDPVSALAQPLHTSEYQNSKTTPAFWTTFSKFSLKPLQSSSKRPKPANFQNERLWAFFRHNLIKAKFWADRWEYLLQMHSIFQKRNSFWKIAFFERFHLINVPRALRTLQNPPSTSSSSKFRNIIFFQIFIKFYFLH